MGSEVGRAPKKVGRRRSDGWLGVGCLGVRYRVEGQGEKGTQDDLLH